MARCLVVLSNDSHLLGHTRTVIVTKEVVRYVTPAPLTARATPAATPQLWQDRFTTTKKSGALDDPAYGQTRAFVDTDGDGIKFDLRQPRRARAITATPAPRR